MSCDEGESDEHRSDDPLLPNLTREQDRRVREILRMEWLFSLRDFDADSWRREFD